MRTKTIHVTRRLHDFLIEKGVWADYIGAVKRQLGKGWYDGGIYSVPSGSHTVIFDLLVHSFYFAAEKSAGYNTNWSILSSINKEGRARSIPIVHEGVTTNIPKSVYVDRMDFPDEPSESVGDLLMKEQEKYNAMRYKHHGVMKSYSPDCFADREEKRRKLLLLT